MHPARRLALVCLTLCAASPLAVRAATPKVPAWAWPGTATHAQVPPPADYHRATTILDVPLGIFEGQSDVGGALVPGSSSFDAKTGAYTIHSAGYNIWYTRDEFRYLWEKMSGDVSLAADITLPNPGGYGDRKAVLIFRQDLDDDSKEVMTALHGAGLIHLALRPEKGADIREACRIEPAVTAVHGSRPIRLGIEKHGDVFSLWVSLHGEAMHQVGTTATLHLKPPFYVGIAFCSHQPVTLDTAVLSDVALANAAGQVH